MDTLTRKKRERLAIFDLDGTLFDTREVNYRAYARAIEACGHRADFGRDAFFSESGGRGYREFLPRLVPGIGGGAMEEVHEEKKRLYASCLKYAARNEWLFDLLKSMRGEYATAVVTTASRRNASEILEAFDSASCFDAVIAQEDVSRLKPDPEGFLLAMGRFGVPPGRTVVFEDSDAGIAAARASGAGCVRVYGFG